MRRPCGWSLPVVILLVGASPVAAASSGSASPLPSRITAQHRQSYHSVSERTDNNDLAKTIIRALEGRRLLPSLLSRSSPALLASTTTTTTTRNSRRSPNDHNNGVALYHHGTLPVSAMQQVLKIPPLIVSKLRERNPPKNTGYYYGLQPDKIFTRDSSRHRAKEAAETQQLAVASALSETLEEMKTMRKELQLLRREMYDMRRKITGEKDLEFDGGFLEEEVDPEVVRLAQQKRQRRYDRLGKEVEDWARKKLFEEARLGNGWTEVACQKMLAKSVNPDGHTTCYMNWMKDSRDKNAFPDDDREYPAIKVYSVIDAPLDDVCTYLSRKEHMTEYNAILTEQRDLEDISPHSKICLAASPQVLFVKPREFVSFVYHRWLKDGSVVMINQACEHKDAPAVKEEGKGKACRAYALRGATFISPDPEDPQKTRFAMISHAAPGGDMPHWMTKTGMIAIAPIEPFKLFHRINQNIANAKPMLDKLKLERMEQVSVPGRSNQPVGFASIGFGCFWPNGGGLAPASSSAPRTPSTSDGQENDSAMQPQPETAAVAE